MKELTFWSLLFRNQSYLIVKLDQEIYQLLLDLKVCGVMYIKSKNKWVAFFISFYVIP